MTLRERFEKLEPRERRLLTILAGILGAAILLALPIYVVKSVSDARSENEQLRALVDSIYDARATIAERKAKHDALLARYGKPAPALAGFIEEASRANNISAAESQDRPDAPHGKRYNERMTVVKMHKVGMLPLAKMLEKIEQSGFAVVVSKLNIKPRAGEADSYEVELGVSAFDRKPDAPAGASSAAPAASAAPDKDL
jgi:type II secretory pathway component PulM